MSLKLSGLEVDVRKAKLKILLFRLSKMRAIHMIDQKESRTVAEVMRIRNDG